MDLYGIRPIGHPRARRLVRHAHWPEHWHPMRAERRACPRVRGDWPLPVRHRRRRSGVYEIPVGPVHAGLIEPGHFRFSVVGETVLRLKARLWFVHRGLEKLFEGRPPPARSTLAERVSGDTSAAHALAHSLAVEDALGIELPDEVHRLRALLIELERLYNHAADIGALANDVGFSPGQHARPTDPRTAAAAQRGSDRSSAAARRDPPGRGACCRRCPTLATLRADRGGPSRGRRADPGQHVVYDRFAGTSMLARERGPRDWAVWATSPGPAVCRTDARLEHPSVALPVTAVSASQPATCWPATPCDATNSPPRSHWPCHLIDIADTRPDYIRRDDYRR